MCIFVCTAADVGKQTDRYRTQFAVLVFERLLLQIALVQIERKECFPNGVFFQITP